MEKHIFGFVIDREIFFDIKNRRLIRISAQHPERSFFVGAVLLSDTLTRLLTYLICECHGNSRITKDEILINVWDKNNLVSSNQKLWQAIRELKIKLSVLGVPNDFIVNVKGAGYFIGNHEIMTLYHD